MRAVISGIVVTCAVIASAYGPSRTFDPIAYYRLQAWQAFDLGSEGSGSLFWAFGTAHGIGWNSWTAYHQKSTEYVPFFVSPDGVMPAKQSEAIRESAYDYEYLKMLSERCGRERAMRYVEEALEAYPCEDYDWDRKGRDHSVLDRLRLRILDELESVMEKTR